jgi:hypothetical protein
VRKYFGVVPSLDYNNAMFVETTFDGIWVRIPTSLHLYLNPLRSQYMRTLINHSHPSRLIGRVV